MHHVDTELELPHYDHEPAAPRDIALKMHQQGYHSVPLGEDQISMFNLHFFLHEVNKGGGLAFLLHSTLSSSKKELYVHNPLVHGPGVPRIGHHDGHLWATIPRMRHDQNMLFCTGHPEGRVAPHAAYPVDSTASDYQLRQSMEIRMLVKETRLSKHRVTPVPLRFTRLLGPGLPPTPAKEYEQLTHPGLPAPGPPPPPPSQLY
jgi:hypothetical protein